MINHIIGDNKIQANGVAGIAALPLGVSVILEFLDGNGIWYLLGENPKALSCRDAANKRTRLGKIGIPLEDELKSFLGQYVDTDGRKRFVAVHCRGDQVLDLEKVRIALGTPIIVERLVTTDVDEDAADIYGLVNPFALAKGFRGEPVIQLFDNSLLEFRGLPNTMMTNAGDRTWSVEFRPGDVVKALGDWAKVADVTETPPTRREGPLSIGIITGNAPDSGILLWQHINRRVQEVMGQRFQGDLSYPPVSVRSVPGLGLSMELDKRSEQVWEQLEPAVRSLCEEGARLLCLACHGLSLCLKRAWSVSTTSATWLNRKGPRKRDATSFAPSLMTKRIPVTLLSRSQKCPSCSTPSANRARVSVPSSTR